MEQVVNKERSYPGQYDYVKHINSLQARVQELERDLEQANRERLDWKRWLIETEDNIKE